MAKERRGRRRTATSTKPGTPAASRPRFSLPRAILTSARGEETPLDLPDFLPLAFLLDEDFLPDLLPFLLFEAFLA